MKPLPDISSEINEDKIVKILAKHFALLGPHIYSLGSNWLIRAYNVYGDIDKYIIAIYLVNRQFIFYRKNNLIVNFNTFFENKSLEIDKINISDISKDLQIPKESVRRKIQEFEKKEVIKRVKKKIFVNRTTFSTDRVNIAIKDVSLILFEFNKILKKEKITNKVFEIEEIINSIKENYSFCWYQFYKFLFLYTKRWRAVTNDLETFCIGMVVVINAAKNKKFAPSEAKSFSSYATKIMGSHFRGINAMSISEVTGIPRATVVRKLKWLIENKFLYINEKKLISLDVTDSSFKKTTDLQKKNMLSFSNFIYRVFNQIKIIDESNLR